MSVWNNGFTENFCSKSYMNFPIWLFKIKDWSFLNPIKFLRNGSMHVCFRGKLAIALGKITNYPPPNYQDRPNYTPKLEKQTFYTFNY